MKRFGRILLNAATLLSLALCLASIALWIRSYWKVDSVIHFKPERVWTQLWIDHVTNVTFRAGPVYEAESRRGILRFLHLHSDGEYFRTEQPAWSSYALKDEDRNFNIIPWSNETRLGFALEHRPINHIVYNAPPGPPSPPPPLTPADFYHALYTPWWIWTSLFAVLPLVRARSACLSRTRRRQGCCVKCGYDLRATPTRCPECGTIPPKQT